MAMRGERLVEIAVGALAIFVLVVLYAPVVIGALFSVIEVNRAGIQWQSFTLSWYARLWENESIMAAIKSTMIVGIGSVAIAVVASVALALYVEWEGAIGRRLIELVIYLPFLLPPIVTGLALLVFFAGLGVNRGLATVAIGHTIFVLAVLYRLVLTRLQALPRTLVEASADLGASRWQTLRYVLWPQLRSAVATGAILAFTLSFDETLISVFLAGDTTTLPLRLWAMMRVGFTPEINALVTLVLIFSIVLALAASLRMKPTGEGDDE
jgi:ABC-type spermidine/putrescine transport system permease subunit II